MFKNVGYIFNADKGMTNAIEQTQLSYKWASLVAQLVKNLPAIWETWV